MTSDAQKKAKQLRRLKPEAWIGYLIGYDSTNIYSIWNPIQSPNPKILLRAKVFKSLPQNSRVIWISMERENMDHPINKKSKRHLTKTLNMN